MTPILPEPEQERTPRYRGVSYTRPIDAAKEAVPIVDLADRLCGPGNLRRVGEKWVARCPLPNHPDRSPSFTVYTTSNSWWCFGCLHGGDVVDLARMAWQYDERDAHFAAADLLHEFGYQVPAQPPAWFCKQERQKPVRDAIDEARVEALARRLWRYVFRPIAADIEDPEERAAMAERLWKVVMMHARHLNEKRKS